MYPRHACQPGISPAIAPATVNPSSAVARKSWLKPNKTVLKPRRPTTELRLWVAAWARPNRKAPTHMNVAFCMSTPAKPTRAHAAGPDPLCHGAENIPAANTVVNSHVVGPTTDGLFNVSRVLAKASVTLIRHWPGDSGEEDFGEACSIERKQRENREKTEPSVLECRRQNRKLLDRKGTATRDCCSAFNYSAEQRRRTGTSM